MGDKDDSGYKVEIPTDALEDALESVEKYVPDKRKTQADGDEESGEEAIVKVEIETEDDDEPGADPEVHAQLIADLEKARTEASEATEKMLRVAADADNVRKRALKERQEAIKFGMEGLLRELLPVIDNLDRTLEHVPQDNKEPALGALRQGVEMIRRLFLGVLENYNVTGFDSVGQPFDPKRHEALSRQESADVDPGEVLSEMHRGYLLHDRLLRPSLVVVSCEPDAGACQETAAEGDEEGEQAGADPTEAPSDEE